MIEKVEIIYDNGVMVGFKTYYSCSKIKNTIYYKEVNEPGSDASIKGRLIVDFGNDSNVVYDNMNIDALYCSQYGLSVTEDGSKIFVQSWERDLRCYCAQSGKCLWKAPFRKVRTIIANHESICFFSKGKGVIVLSSDGEFLHQLSTTATDIIDTGQGYLFLINREALPYNIHRSTDLKKIQSVPSSLFEKFVEKKTTSQDYILIRKIKIVDVGLLIGYQVGNVKRAVNDTLYYDIQSIELLPELQNVV